MKGFVFCLRLLFASAVITAGLTSGRACWADDVVGSLPNAPAVSKLKLVDLISGRSLPERADFSRGRRELGLDGKDERSTNVVRPLKSEPHPFWDRENAILFSLVGASRALDYASTLNMRRRGVQEIFLTNDVVDNHAAFAAIEVGGTAVSIGASYLFHRYHHHRLERWTSIIHASLATGGAVRNYCLKTAHPSSTP